MTRLKSLAFLILVSLAAACTRAPKPNAFPGQSVGAEIPRAVLNDEQGQRIELRDLISQSERTWLVPVYYECPGPCTLVIERVMDRLEKDPTLRKELGLRFQVVFFTFDPKESFKLAQAKREKTLARRAEFRAPEAPGRGSIRFLSGGATFADLVCRSLFFKYILNTIDGVYTHDLKVFELDRSGVVKKEYPLAELPQAHVSF